MGNRAIITTKDKEMGIYLQWNGGRDSIEAFLEYCKLKGYRSPEADDSYAFARLTQIISNYLGGNLSIGIIGNCSNSEPCCDNGNYIIGGNWEIVGRDYPYESFEEQKEYNLKKMLQEIDKAQPMEQQLGKFLYAKEKNIENLKKGDMVYIQDYGGNYKKFAVIGFGKNKVVNGTNVLNIPYVNKYGDKETCEDNINNYIRTDKVRIYNEGTVSKKQVYEEMEVDE